MDDDEEELQIIWNAVNDNHFVEASNDDILHVFDSSSDLTGTTTMDTTEAIISDLQQIRMVVNLLEYSVRN